MISSLHMLIAYRTGLILEMINLIRNNSTFAGYRLGNRVR
jgi:hypothetical protein